MGIEWESIVLVAFIMVVALLTIKIIEKKTNKWLAEQLGKDPATISKWCTNSSQPSVETLMQIAKCLDVEVHELLHPVDKVM